MPTPTRLSPCINDYDLSFVLASDPDDAFTVAEFAANNTDARACDDWCSALRALPVGGELSLGGGACPSETVRRVA